MPVVDERVAPPENPFRVVGVEGERKALKLGAPAEPRAGGKAVCLRIEAPNPLRGELTLEREPAFRASSDLADLLVEMKPLTADLLRGSTAERREGSCALERGAPRVVLEARRSLRELAAGTDAVERDGDLSGMSRSGAADGGDVIKQRAIAVMPDGGDDGNAEKGDRPAESLVAETEEVSKRATATGDDRDVNLLAGGEVCKRARDRRRGASILHGREAPDEPPGPAPPAKGGEQIAPRLAMLAADDSNALRQRRDAKRLLTTEQALSVERPADAIDLEQKVAFAGDPGVGDSEAKRRRGGRAARVEVAATLNDELCSLGEASSVSQRPLPVIAPRGAGDRTGAVAKLEVRLCTPNAKVDELTDDLDARKPPKSSLERGRVLADGIGSRQGAARDAAIRL
jgi:hypothetical protein